MSITNDSVKMKLHTYHHYEIWRHTGIDQFWILIYIEKEKIVCKFIILFIVPVSMRGVCVAEQFSRTIFFFFLSPGSRGCQKRTSFYHKKCDTKWYVFHECKTAEVVMIWMLEVAQVQNVVIALTKA